MDRDNKNTGASALKADVVTGAIAMADMKDSKTRKGGIDSYLRCHPRESFLSVEVPGPPLDSPCSVMSASAFMNHLPPHQSRIPSRKCIDTNDGRVINDSAAALSLSQGPHVVSPGGKKMKATKRIDLEMYFRSNAEGIVGSHSPRRVSSFRSIRHLRLQCESERSVGSRASTSQGVRKDLKVCLSEYDDIMNEQGKKLP